MVSTCFPVFSLHPRVQLNYQIYVDGYFSSQFLIIRVTKQRDNQIPIELMDDRGGERYF